MTYKLVALILNVFKIVWNFFKKNTWERIQARKKKLNKQRESVRKTGRIE